MIRGLWSRGDDVFICLYVIFVYYIFQMTKSKINISFP